MYGVTTITSNWNTEMKTIYSISVGLDVPSLAGNIFAEMMSD